MKSPYDELLNLYDVLIDLEERMGVESVTCKIDSSGRRTYEIVLDKGRTRVKVIRWYHSWLEPFRFDASTSPDAYAKIKGLTDLGTIVVRGTWGEEDGSSPTTENIPIKPTFKC
jgi:hypothetical protein